MLAHLSTALAGIGGVVEWSCGGVVTPRRNQALTPPPARHHSIAHSPVSRCGRRPPQRCRWRWHQGREVRARDFDGMLVSVPRWPGSVAWSWGQI
eukprot:2612737-Prymnesium_polylepis.1